MMKCQKCDLPIKNNDKYCGNCGTKIKKENRVLKFLDKNKTKIIVITIITITLFTIYNVLSYLTSPTYISNQYFKDVVSNNYEDIYKTIRLEDSEFMNIETLSKKSNSYDIVDDIYITNKIITNNEALITYTYKENNKIYRASVSLTKRGNKWLFFDNWIINSGKIASNITLKFPIGSTVTIDNIDITKYLAEQTNNYDMYKIDYMVSGDYEVKVKLLDGQEIIDNITVSDNNIYEIGNIDLSDEIKLNVIDETNNLITDIYKNILNSSSYENIKYNENIKRIYKNLNYNYKNSALKLQNIKFNDFDVVSATFKNGKLNVEFRVEYNYVVNYNINEEQKTYNGTNRGLVVASYSYEDKYIIDNIEKINLSFPIRK